jgi:protocatechuate 3,4-dioxygenase alpha subunit
MPPVTPSQTIGPFWHMLADPLTADLTRFEPAGARLQITGRVTDGDGAPIGDACVEIWQATPRASPEFPGWGRCATNVQGAYHFITVSPDRAAPYLGVAVFARGLVKPLWTRVYLADIADALLTSLPADRRSTLIAQPVAGAPASWRWDIRLQGDGETVFLEF